MFENPRRGQASKKFYNKCSENSRSQIVFRRDIFRKLSLGATVKFLVETFSANLQSNEGADDASEAALPKRPRLEAEDFYIPLHAGVSMPTGSGKTGIVCFLPYYLGSIGLEEPPPGSLATGKPRHHFKKPILVLAPNLDHS